MKIDSTTSFNFSVLAAGVLGVSTTNQGDVHEEVLLICLFPLSQPLAVIGVIRLATKGKASPNLSVAGLIDINWGQSNFQTL